MEALYKTFHILTNPKEKYNYWRFQGKFQGDRDHESKAVPLLLCIVTFFENL